MIWGWYKYFCDNGGRSMFNCYHFFNGCGSKCPKWFQFLFSVFTSTIDSFIPSDQYSSQYEVDCPCAIFSLDRGRLPDVDINSCRCQHSHTNDLGRDYYALCQFYVRILSQVGVMKLINVPNIDWGTISKKSRSANLSKMCYTL